MHLTETKMQTQTRQRGEAHPQPFSEEFIQFFFQIKKKMGLIVMFHSLYFI